MTRASAIVAGLTAAVALWALGAIFDLNGDQWSWWGDASWVTAVLVLVVAVRGRLRVRTGIAAAGALLTAAAVVVMASRYSDPYAGPLLWPHVLAVLAFVGVVTVLAGVARLR